MVESLYPHESPAIRIIVGGLLLLVAIVIYIGTMIGGWFLPTPELLPSEMWCSTYNVILKPTLFGCDPIIVSVVIFVSGVIIGLSALFIPDQIIDVKPTDKYCPYCKRRVP
jgi:hypothetical protein